MPSTFDRRGYLTPVFQSPSEIAEDSWERSQEANDEDYTRSLLATAESVSLPVLGDPNHHQYLVFIVTETGWRGQSTTYLKGDAYNGWIYLSLYTPWLESITRLPVIQGLWHQDDVFMAATRLRNFSNILRTKDQLVRELLQIIESRYRVNDSHIFELKTPRQVIGHFSELVEFFHRGADVGCHAEICME